MIWNLFSAGHIAGEVVGGLFRVMWNEVKGTSEVPSTVVRALVAYTYGSVLGFVFEFE